MIMHGIDIRIARIVNTYAPRMLLNDVILISNLLIQSIYWEYLNIYGNGNQTRSFWFIKSSNICLINLANPEELTIL